MTPSEILCQLIATPSVNPMGRDLSGEMYNESRMSDWLENYFQRLGAEYERVEVAPGRANVIARYDAGDCDHTILMDAHQDTVPVDGMTIEPFQPQIRDGHITGRGAADVKGGMAAMLHAFTRLFTERAARPVNVILSCTCDEEATTLGVQDLVGYWQARGAKIRPPKSSLLAVRPSCAVIAEPTELDVVVAHRGVVRCQVHTHGVAVHSSEPNRGKNAIYDMARVVSQLETIAGQLPATIPPHPLCGSASLSVGRIEGGTSVNIVPASCRIEIDRRVIPGEDPGQVWESLSAACTKVSPSATCDPPWVSSPALASDDNRWVAQSMLRNIAEVTSPRQSIGVPYCTHAGTISAAGVPAIVFGPGSIHQAHTQDEFIDIRALDQAAEIYFRFCTDVELFSAR